MNTYSLNASGGQFKKTEKTKGNLGYFFASYSSTGKYWGLKLHHRSSSEVRNHLKKNSGGDLQPLQMTSQQILWC